MTDLRVHPDRPTVLAGLLARGITRRTLLKLCAGLAAGLALPAAEAATIARALAQEPRPQVLWLALQGCTGCTESTTRAHEPTLESLILESLSLDYHTTLMAAAGDAAQSALREGLREPGYVLVVEGALPRPVGICTSGGEDDAALLCGAATGASLILSEKEGCTPEIEGAATMQVRIPINAKVESLNVSAAPGITLFNRVKFNRK